MDVELYVYDLSQGLARQFSLAIAGVQIDAIYHTAIVFGNVEYFFGQGIHRKVPGSTHHGRPMKVLPLGKTELPRDVIDEYLESLEAIYTPESYDLFLHNCNNFSQDLATFLVGKSIPDEIRNLPETFLKTPMGQMLRGQLDRSMRQMTQAPDAMSGQNVQRPTTSRSSVQPNGTTAKPQLATFANGLPEISSPGTVKYPQNVGELDQLLKVAEASCAAIFFTSATCPPCKILYPVYDELAAEAGSKATLIKVDVSKVYDIGMKYQVRATPTIMTFLKGKKDQEWAGADVSRLRGNIRLLVQMSSPQHAHTRLNLPSFHAKIEKPIMYTRAPPMPKLLAKLGTIANDHPLVKLANYIEARETTGLINTPVCDMQPLSDWYADRFARVPVEVRFACVDLLRIAATDPRVSSFLAVEQDLRSLSQIVPADEDLSSWPYNLQAVTLQLACNLFGSQVFQDIYIADHGRVRQLLEQLASQCLLAEHHNARLLAAALIYNMAAYDHNERVEGRKDRVALSNMDSLEAALVDAVVREEGNVETLHALLLALGLMLYAGPADSSLHELCGAMEVRESLKAKSKMADFRKEPLLKEIGEELLGKGFPS